MAQRGMLKTAVVTTCLLVLALGYAGGCGGGAQADMVFILDASGSVGSGNFQSMLRFVRDLVDAFDIGSNTIRVGVQRYSHVTNTEFNLDDYYDKNAMKNRIMAVHYTGGGTNTASALAYCRTTMFTSGNGDRANVPNIAVVLTDGVSWPYPGPEALNLRNTGCTIFSVGIGSGIPLGELNEMATDPDSDHVFAVSGFSALNNIKNAFQSQACPPVNGNWGSWGSYGSCSKTCGSGSKSRSRSCDNPAPSNGGNQCSGSSSETASCNTQACSACASGSQVDVVFILDASGSVGSSNFQTMLQFVRDLVDTFDISSNGIRVGVQKYSSGTNTEFNLNQYYDKNAMKTRIMSIVFTGGSTNTGGALSYCRTNMFTTANGDRSNVVNVIVVLSDGISNNGVDTANQARACRDVGMRIFSVGIGSGIPMSELNEMATDPDSEHVFAVSNFQALQGIKTAFGNKACGPTNGGWGSWGSYGSCSKTCATGTKSRTRSCNSPPPSNGGSQCSGATSDSTTCNTHGCPVNGNWGNWVSWGSCTKSCGGGSKSRSRSCDNPAPLHGGAQCGGSSSDSTSCNTHPCAVNGAWTTWTSWGTCSTTCELGSWTRTRSCTNPAPAHGGLNCVGVTSETSSCNLRPCPVDGGWSGWQAWGVCSVTCMAVGVRSRIRDCDNPTPLHGGAQCPGPGTDTSTCDMRLTLCSPGNGWAKQVYSTTPGTPVDGGLGSWGQWSPCTKTCGAGLRLRQRQCNNPIPRFGGLECSGTVMEKEICGNTACPGSAGYVQTCPDRYFDCASGNLTCVHYLKKCDCTPDCDDASDEDPEWAGCIADSGLCNNRARLVNPHALMITVLFCVAALLPAVWRHLTH